MKPLLASAFLMLAVMGLAVSTPAVRAVTSYSLGITVTVDGKTATTVVSVLDGNEDGVVSVDVSNDLLARIQEAFGTTEFVFPGSYTATFSISGHTVTVSLQSDDSFTLEFI